MKRQINILTLSFLNIQLHKSMPLKSCPWVMYLTLIAPYSQILLARRLSLVYNHL